MTFAVVFEEESPAVADILDNNDELEHDTDAEELEDQDELGDEELQSMLQDDDASAGAITDTANTDWYLRKNPCRGLLYCAITDILLSHRMALKGMINGM